MNKNYYYNQTIYFYLLFLLIFYLVILLIINQLLYGSVIYCDNSINSSTNIIESFNLEDQVQSQAQANSTINEEDININCSTIFTSYRDIVRRKLF